jgi:hypothetical protein
MVRPVGATTAMSTLRRGLSGNCDVVDGCTLLDRSRDGRSNAGMVDIATQTPAAARLTMNPRIAIDVARRAEPAA